jgi:hypothetical protein
MKNTLLKKMTTALSLAVALGVSCNANAFDNLNDLTYINEYKNTWEYASSYTGGFGGTAFDDMSEIKKLKPWVTSA